MVSLATPLLTLEDLVLGYDRRPAVHHLSGEIRAGSLTAIIGPNGAGKSTLLKGLAGLLPPLSGRIRRHGLKPGQIGYLPQQAEIDRSFPISVSDFVSLGQIRRRGWLGGLSAGDRRGLTDALHRLGLQGFEARPIGSLSGGQMQRVLFARLLVQDAPVLLLDEPFTALDGASIVELGLLIRRWHEEGRTILAVSHDLGAVARDFPEALLLAREPVAWGPTAQVLTPERLARARGLAEAWDPRAADCAHPASPTAAMAAAGA